MNEMSIQYHRLFRDRLIPSSFRLKRQPVLVNSYFGVNHQAMVDLARGARTVGCELAVLDDGWFGNRNDDSTSLGDWYAHKERFPDGIKLLSEDVNREGMQFGLWIEPEMVSEDSDLYRRHPDWCLHVPGRPSTRGRNQLVLDITREEVREYIFQTISGIILESNYHEGAYVDGSTVTGERLQPETDGMEHQPEGVLPRGITYIKWDMNRHLTDVYSAAPSATPETQQTIFFRFVLGSYWLFARFTQTFPDILFESCSGGGGRFDPGMLYYTPQIWCSDNTDAFKRMKIQYGTSLVYPPFSMGAHYSVVPNHITHNLIRSRTRALCAMAGSYGYELNLSPSKDPEDDGQPMALAAGELEQIQQYTAFFKRVALVLRQSDFYRLLSPYEAQYASWMFVTQDKSRAFVFAFNRNSQVSRLVPRLKLQGLVPEAKYAITEPLPNDMIRDMNDGGQIKEGVLGYQFGTEKLVVTGKTLMKAGLPLQFLSFDDSQLFELNLEPKCALV